MSKKLMQHYLNLVMAGILAAALLGGCGSQPREGSGEISSSSPTRSEASESVIPSQSLDSREVVDPFDNFELVYFETAEEAPVILGGENILKAAGIGGNYSLSPEEKETEERRQEADNERYRDHTILLLTGRLPSLHAEIINTHEKKIVSYIIYRNSDAPADNPVPASQGEVITIKAKTDYKKRYRLSSEEKTVTVGSVARYLSFSPDDSEENDKIWQVTKAAHEADPIRIGATTSLDVSYSFADSSAIIAMDYPELEIISWESVTPLGVVVRCNLHNWKDLRNCYSDPVDLMGHYAVLSSSCLVEHADGTLSVEPYPNQSRFTVQLFSTENTMLDWFESQNVRTEYIMPIDEKN